MKKILFIIGTKPEAIKLTPLILYFKERSVNVKVCSTNQQKDILEKVFHSFNIKFDFVLDFQNKNQNLTELTGKILLELNKIKENFDLIVVHGDTTSSFCGALYSFYNKIPLAHIESGLRSNDIFSPMPEEVNRKFIDNLAQFHFAPNENNKNNLLREGINEHNIHVTGNTIVDMLYLTIKKDYNHFILDWAADSKLIICSLHRRENWNKIDSFLISLNRFLENNEEYKMLYILNSNPFLEKVVNSFHSSKILFHKPLDVVDFHNILSRSHSIVSDSGGLQEEAVFLEKPMLVMRENTERQELVENFCGRTINFSDIDKELFDFFKNYHSFEKNKTLYGDGKASEKIYKVLSEFMLI